MTTFGVYSSSDSPAHRRMVADGRAFEIRRRRYRLASPAQRRLALLLRRAHDDAKARATEADRLRRQREARPSMRAILDHVSQRTGISTARILGPRRTRPIVAARHEAFWLCRQWGRSLLEIGSFFHRDHTSVLYGVRAHSGVKRKRGAGT